MNLLIVTGAWGYREGTTDKGRPIGLACRQRAGLARNDQSAPSRLPTSSSSVHLGVDYPLRYPEGRVSCRVTWPNQTSRVFGRAVKTDPLVKTRTCIRTQRTSARQQSLKHDLFTSCLCTNNSPLKRNKNLLMQK